MCGKIRFLSQISIQAMLCSLLIPWTLATGGCGTFVDHLDIPQKDLVSECGGFGKVAADDGRALLWGPPLAYCDAEVISWEYDATAQTLKLTDSRVLLNCCGKHTMTVEWYDDTYVFTENDAPDNFGRCTCMCVFDFNVEVQQLQASSIPIRIMRETTDDELAPANVFETVLDLTPGSGEIIIDDVPIDIWCQNP